MGYQLVFTKRAKKDAENLERANLKEKTVSLLRIIKENPFQNPPPYEKLVGDLKGAYCRRINIQHWLVYEVLAISEMAKDAERAAVDGILKVVKMWTQYE